MFLKVSRGVWLISILGALAALLFVYASLPEEVVLFEDGPQFLALGREPFFYLVLGLITLVNAFVFMVSALFKRDEGFRGWFNGLISTINLFFVISLFFINSLNSGEKFNFEKIGFLTYASVVIVALWAIAWPIYAAIRKFSTSRPS
jgi:hypothetical protein